ncbi:MAG: cobalamin biosynthesis protein CobD [Chloroflexi bacterium RBG_16_50_9]|nr:MAG: cobalamin biosynthesis protein CobD [Chloroflexi bacterium RBG_16_50_9]
MEIILILALALILDLVPGDPPGAIHPVAWMGKSISLLAKGGHGHRPAVQFLYGIIMTLFTMALFIIPAYLILNYLENFNSIAYVIAAAVLLKCTFTISGLRRASLKVKKLLQDDKIGKARFELRALVSRNTEDLPPRLVVSATVESVAENTCDSLVAPLFYFLLFGVPGAIGYRVVNTLDSMIGYHGKYEYLGKFAARLDDVLNYIPARLTALLLVLAAFIVKSNGHNSWLTALKHHARTGSPNAGWPMAAMAGALDVRLEKVGHYQLGKEVDLLVPDTIESSIKIFLIAAALWSLICFFVGVIHFVITA